MKSSFSRFAFTCCFCATLTIASAAKDKDATAKVTHGEPFKSKSSFALGAFRVAFVTEDKVSSVSKGLMSGHGGSSSFMYGELVGVDHPLMQKIADRIYADFLKQAAAKGYTIVDSTQLAKTSPAYSAMEAAENFAEGRLGTVVIPTGQRSVPLAADDSAKAQRGAGAGSMMSSIHNLGTLSAKAEANKAFPEASKEAGVPVLGVTIVVNFADFKGGVSTFATSSKATIMAGATIDGTNGLSSATSIMGWDTKTLTCAGCMGQVALIGQVHSAASIGSLESHSKMKTGDRIANGIGALGGLSQTNKRGAVLTADPASYETNVLLVAAQASDILLSAMAKDK